MDVPSHALDVTFTRPTDPAAIDAPPYQSPKVVATGATCVVPSVKCNVNVTLGVVLDALPVQPIT